MQAFHVSILLLLSTFSALSLVGCDKKDGAKLQVGIKHRPETCPIKAKKGDKLEMHYKVQSSDPE